MNYYRNDIRHVKGDTYSSGLVIEGLGQTVDSIYFTCRENLNDSAEILFQSGINDGISLVEYDEEKDIKKYAVRIDPSKTRNLQSGTYYYDLEVSVNSDVFTVMKGKFIIEQDATREDNEQEDETIILIKSALDEINGEVISVDVSEKLLYLNNTKELLKDRINYLGADLTEESTFRSYVNSLKTIYDDYPKVSDTGTSINLTNTKKGRLLVDLNPSEISQNGNPTPENPISIHTVNGNNTIIIDDGDEAEQNYSINLGTLEYCKKGTYANKIFKNTSDDSEYDSGLNENEWYMKKNIKKIVLDGTENWVLNSNYQGKYRYTLELNDLIHYDNNNGTNVSALSDYFLGVPTNEWSTSANSITVISNKRLMIVSTINTLAQFKSWLATHNAEVYYVLNGEAYINITQNYPTLATQLENLKNTKSYNDETNISQINNDLPFVFEATALMKGDE